MTDWKYLELDESEALTRLHLFSVKKKHPSGEIEIRITVREFATPEIGAFQYLAMGDIELNQNTAAFYPTGFSNTLMGALSACLKNIRTFDYEGAEQSLPSAV